jgi:hypothetical protein
MNLNLAPALPKGNSAARKFFRKALAYLANGGNDGGERHEVNAIYKAMHNEIRFDATPYQPADGSCFSTDVWPGYNNLKDHQLKKVLQDELMASAASKVFAGGHHEVDAVLQAGGTHERVILECKSGAAHSTKAQLSSYVELLLTLSNPVPPAVGVVGAPAQTNHHFAYCYDASGDPSEEHLLGLFHRFLSNIPDFVVTAASPPLFGPAKAYLANINYSNAENARPAGELEKIFEYETSNPLPVAVPAGLGGGAAGLLNAWPKKEEYAEKANEVLRQRFGFRLGIINIGKVTDAKVKEWATKYAGILNDTERSQKLVDLAAKYT